MQSLIQKSILSFIIIFAVLSQSLIYDSGLCFMRTVRQICTCNHNSVREIHSKDLAKSDCHDTKKTVHICSCKKPKNPNELSNLIKQIFFISFFNSSKISIQLRKYILPVSNHLVNLKGFGLTLIKPADPRSRLRSIICSFFCLH